VATKGIYLLKYQRLSGQSLGITQKWLPFVGQIVATFVGRTM